MVLRVNGRVGLVDDGSTFFSPATFMMSGVTSMLGGGTGPAHGTFATTCTPGPWHLGRMIQAADARLGERDVLGDARVEVMAHHQHVEMLVERVDGIRARRIGR